MSSLTNENEAEHDKTDKNLQITCAPCEDWSAYTATQSDRVFVWRSIGSYELNASSCGQRRLWSDWADLSLRWAHRSFGWFCHAPAQICFKMKTGFIDSLPMFLIDSWDNSFSKAMIHEYMNWWWDGGGFGQRGGGLSESSALCTM